MTVTLPLHDQVSLRGEGMAGRLPRAALPAASAEVVQGGACCGEQGGERHEAPCSLVITPNHEAPCQALSAPGYAALTTPEQLRWRGEAGAAAAAAAEEAAAAAVEAAAAAAERRRRRRRTSEASPFPRERLRRYRVGGWGREAGEARFASNTNYVKCAPAPASEEAARARRDCARRAGQLAAPARAPHRVAPSASAPCCRRLRPRRPPDLGAAAPPALISNPRQPSKTASRHAQLGESAGKDFRQHGFSDCSRGSMFTMYHRSGV